MWTSSKKPPSLDQRPLFVNTAEVFCAHIESAASADRVNFIRVCFILLSKLLSEVIELPEVTATSDAQSVTDERYDEILQTLKDQFGDKNYYTTMFDSYEIASEPSVGSVSDDLADIWRDVKNGLEALRDGSLERAVAHWRSSFKDGWGDQATLVLRPLVTLIFKDERFENVTP